MKISVIVTAHNEGVMLDATVKTVLFALTYIQQDSEIILHLDNPTDETTKVAKKYHDHARVRVFENYFGDIGPARNFAANVAKGEILFFIDGDDLVSREYFVKMLEVLEKNPETVVSPEMMAEFDSINKRGAVFRMEDSGTKEEQAFLLFSVNCWTMAIAGRKKIFLEHPYIESINGYGHEDYALNIELAGADIPHLVAPGAIYFVRRKKMSRQKWNDAEHNTQPRSALFDFEFWKKMKTDEKLSKVGLREFYTKLQGNRLIRGVMKPAGKIAKRMLTKTSSDLPASLLSEWRKVAEIEPVAMPDKLKMNTLGLGGVNKCCPASVVYQEICRDMPEKLDTVAVVTKLNSPDELKNKIGDEKEGRILVLTTKRQKTIEWPENVTWVDMEQYLKKLASEQAETLVTRLLVQTGAKIIIEPNGYGARWLKEHEKLAKTLEVKVAE